MALTLSDILLSIVAAVGTLTPLILGLMKYLSDKKKAGTIPGEAAATDAGLVVAVGDTVDFESIAVKALQNQIDYLTDSVNDLTRRLRRTESERDRAREVLRRNDIQIP